MTNRESSTNPAISETSPLFNLPPLANPELPAHADANQLHGEHYDQALEEISLLDGMAFYLAKKTDQAKSRPSIAADRPIILISKDRSWSPRRPVPTYKLLTPNQIDDTQHDVEEELIGLLGIVRARRVHLNERTWQEKANRPTAD